MSVCECGRVCVGVVGFGREWEGVRGCGGERECVGSLCCMCAPSFYVCVGGGEGVRTSQGCAGGGGWVYFRMSPSTCMPEGSHCMPEASLTVVESSVNVQCTSKAL